MDREIHFYDQTPDGDRRERFVDDKYESKVRDTLLDESLKDIIEENAPTMKKLFESSIPSEYDLDPDLARLEAEGLKIKAFTDKVDKAGVLENLTEEEREKLRIDLLSSGLFDGSDQEVHRKTTSNSEVKQSPEKEKEKSYHHQAVEDNESDEPSRLENLFSPTNFSQDEKSQNEQKITLERFPVTKFPASYKDNIHTLQDCLRAYTEHRPSKNRRGMASKVTKDMLRSHLARSYLLARKGLLAAPDQVPPKLWNILWEIFDSRSEENVNRLVHIRCLGEDMDEVGVVMSFKQRLIYVEALFMDGARKIAIEQWNVAKPPRDNPLWDEYWEIGLRMLAHTGRVKEAFIIAETYFKDMQQPERYRALLPLIWASLKSKDEYSTQRAWALYIRLRVNLGDKMTMEDYDLVIMWFMEEKKSELALAIFRDMMLTNDESKTIYDSTALHKISGIISDFSGVNIEQSELEWKDTRALAVLPAKFRNKFFFGSWIKKLIGDNQLASAEKVIYLMQDFGIRPSPMHMNGLIGAWFRRGNENDFAKADDMAWRMIKNRLETVQLRFHRHSLEKPLRPNPNGYCVADKSALLLPVATIETFTLLVQQYRQRQRYDSLDALFTAFLKTRIPPNTKYMNQIILTDTRGHKTNLAFDTYWSLTERGIKPNFETFILLWNLKKISADPSVGRKSDKRWGHSGTCRHLFAELMKWKSTLTQGQSFPPELYDLIILSFSLSQDQVGCAVAIYALEREFRIYPDAKCLRALVLQLARHGLLNRVGMKPRRLNLSLPMTRERIACVSEFFAQVKNKRSEALRAKGFDPDKLPPEARKRESIGIMVDVLRHVTVAKLLGEERKGCTSAMLAEQAAKQMGVPNYVVWEVE
ncbi:hypothetical protein K3495_g2091 [Podosphaera aphanis]|nr:hypothetical protein K3495_g2091 [Podosphaera aphanis]